MSMFGTLVKKCRKEKGLTLEAVAKKIGSHKGYVSGIENDKVNPPSVKVIQKFAKLFGQDVKELTKMAWVDKSPQIIRAELIEQIFGKNGTKKEAAAPVTPAATADATQH